MKHLLPILALFLFQGCAADVYKNLTAPTPKGHVEFRLSAEVQGVSLTMDDSLVVNDKFTKRVLLRNIGEGKHYFKVSGPAGNRNKPLSWSDSVMVRNNETKTILVDTPAVSSGYWVYIALITIPSIVIVNMNY